MIFRTITAKEFEKFCKKSKIKNFMQSPAMWQRYQDNQRESYLLGVEDNGKIIAAGIIARYYQKLKFKLFNCPLGWLADYDNEELIQFITKESKSFLRDKGGILLLTNPYIQLQRRDSENNVIESNIDNQHVVDNLIDLGYKNLGEFDQVKWNYAISLDEVREIAFKKDKLDEELLLSTFRTNNRRYIRYAVSRYGVSLRKLKKDELKILYDATAQAEKKHKFRGRNLAYYESMFEAFGEDICVLAAEIPESIAKGDVDHYDKLDKAEQKKLQSGKKIVISSAIFINYGNEVVYLAGGSWAKYSKFGGSHLIQYEMIKFAIENGYKKYNFWGTHPEEGNGVYEFKKGFRGEVEELIGCFALPIGPVGKLYLSRLKYQQYLTMD